jgi:Domain of unknown function (DUF4390)
MIRVILLRCFGVLFPCMAMLASPAWGQQQRPVLHELSLTHTGQEVLLHINLQGGFHQELLEAIESGIPITITYYMKLYRKRGLWFDEEVLAKTIKHMVKYDTLKRQYRVSEINGLFSGIKVTKDEPTMVRWMSEIEGQPLIPFHLLQAGEEYYVKAMADLKAVQSPFPLSHIPFLASLWDTGTPWAVSSPFTISTPQPQR